MLWRKKDVYRAMVDAVRSGVSVSKLVGVLGLAVAMDRCCLSASGTSLNHRDQ